MNTSVSTDLEAFFGALADALDAVGPEREALMLTKLALLLARELGDAGRAQSLIEQACLDL